MELPAWAPGPRSHDRVLAHRHLVPARLVPDVATALYPRNHFGDFEDWLKKLAEACERIRFEGVKDIRYAITDTKERADENLEGRGVSADE
jgi:hypothetical protein